MLSRNFFDIFIDKEPQGSGFSVRLVQHFLLSWAAAKFRLASDGLLCPCVAVKSNFRSFYYFIKLLQLKPARPVWSCWSCQAAGDADGDGNGNGDGY